MKKILSIILFASTLIYSQISVRPNRADVASSPGGSSPTPIYKIIYSEGLHTNGVNEVLQWDDQVNASIQMHNSDSTLCPFDSTSQPEPFIQVGNSRYLYCSDAPFDTLAHVSKFALHFWARTDGSTISIAHSYGYPGWNLSVNGDYTNCNFYNSGNDNNLQLYTDAAQWNHNTDYHDIWVIGDTTSYVDIYVDSVWQSTQRVDATTFPWYELADMSERRIGNENGTDYIKLLLFEMYVGDIPISYIHTEFEQGKP